MRIMAAGTAQVVLGLWIARQGTLRDVRADVQFGWVVAVAGVIFFLLGRGALGAKRWARGTLMFLCVPAALFWGLGGFAAMDSGEAMPVVSLALLAAGSCLVTFITAWRSVVAVPPRRGAARAAVAPAKPKRLGATERTELDRLRSLQTGHRYYEILGVSPGDSVIKITERYQELRRRYPAAQYPEHAAVIDDAFSHVNSVSKKACYDLSLQKMDQAVRRANEEIRKRHGFGAELNPEGCRMLREDAWARCWQVGATNNPGHTGNRLEALMDREIDDLITRLRDAI